jgi:hypothetical protein
MVNISSAVVCDMVGLPGARIITHTSRLTGGNPLLSVLKTQQTARRTLITQRHFTTKIENPTVRRTLILERRNQNQLVFSTAATRANTRLPQMQRGQPVRLTSLTLSGESGIRTRGPRFQGHIISNDAHSATLPSLHRDSPFLACRSRHNIVGCRLDASSGISGFSRWFPKLGR